MKNIKVFLSENVQFLEVKFSIYLNRCVCVMLFPSLFFFFLFCVEVLRPSQPIRSCRARSVYLTTRLLGRLSPLSG